MSRPAAPHEFAAWFERRQDSPSLAAAFTEALEHIEADKAAQAAQDTTPDPHPTTDHEMTDDELLAAIAADAERN